jgi:SAM-dependent methyltransferase
MKSFWNERYAQDVYVYGDQPNAFFKEALQRPDISAIQGGLMLLPCEGEGRNAVYSASLGWQVTALDYAEQGKIKAMALAEKNKVSICYALSDIETYPLSDCSFDVIGLIFAHFPPETRAGIHHRLAQALRPGGFIVLQAFGKDQLQYASGGPSRLEMLYDIETLLEDFSALSCIYQSEQIVTLREGPYHHGEGAVVSMILQKQL